MKKMKNIIIKLMLALVLFVGITAGATESVQAATKTGTHYYTCTGLHDYYCMHVRLAAEFSSSKCTDVYWQSSSTHWPNGVTFGVTKKYTSYARGTYTIYSSLITQWASIAFSSDTDTIYIYK